MFVDHEGNEVKSENLQKLAEIVVPLTERFTKECQEAAERLGIDLTVVVKFIPSDEINLEEGA